MLKLADGGHLYYEVTGERGPWLVLMNGLMMGSSSWEPHVGALSAECRLLRLDFRDQARSSRLSPGYRAEQHVRDTCALLDHLGIAQAHVHGVSYGGQVALAMMAERPERVASLCLASITAAASSYLQAVGRAWQVAARRRDGLAFFELCMPYVYSPGFYARCGDWIQQRQHALSRVLDDAWFEGFERLAQSADHFDYRAVLPTIEVPTSLICGTEDMLTPLSDMRQMAAQIRRSRLVELPGTGHGAVLELPDDYAQAVVDHLAWAGNSPAYTAPQHDISRAYGRNLHT